jgi:hypothetical protein
MVIARDVEHSSEDAINRPNMPPIARRALVGALGGLAGTCTMSVLMVAAQRAGLMGRLPPERITQKSFFKGFRSPARERRKNMLAALLHVGFGIAGGVGFGIMAFRNVASYLLIVGGMLYATGIWFVSYMGWVPALRLMPPADKDRPDRQVVMVVAHWIYGATLGMVLGAFRSHRQ